MATPTTLIPRIGGPPSARGVRPLALPVAVALILGALIYLASPNFRAQPVRGQHPYGGDFLQEWIGGYIVRAGDCSRFYDPTYARTLEHDPRLVGFTWDRHRYLPMVYPPFYYVLVSPLSRLPLKAAVWVWAALMSGCLAGAVAVAWRWLAVRWPVHLDPRRRTWLAWCLPAAVLFVPLIECLTTGQKATVCLLILTGTFVLLDTGRPLRAGLVFGLLAFKPQLTLVIGAAMLLKGQWRFIAGGILTGAVLVGLSLALGPDVCQQYVRFSTGAADYIATSGYALHKSHCLYGFFTLLAGGQPTLLVKLVTAAAAVATAAVLARLLRGPLVPGRARFAVQFAALVIATVLFSPHLLTYDLTILLLPMVLMLALLTWGHVPVPARMQWPWWLGLLYLASAVSPSIARHVGIQITTPVMLLFLIVLARSTAAQRGTSGIEWLRDRWGRQPAYWKS